MPPIQSFRERVCVGIFTHEHDSIKRQPRSASKTREFISSNLSHNSQEDSNTSDTNNSSFHNYPKSITLPINYQSHWTNYSPVRSLSLSCNTILFCHILSHAMLHSCVVLPDRESARTGLDKFLIHLGSNH